MSTNPVKKLSKRERFQMGVDFIGGFSIPSPEDPSKVIAWIDFQTNRVFHPKWKKISTPFIPALANQSFRTKEDHKQAIKNLREYYESTSETNESTTNVNEEGREAILQIIANVQKIARGNRSPSPNPIRMMEEKTGIIKKCQEGVDKKKAFSGHIKITNKGRLDR